MRSVGIRHLWRAAVQKGCPENPYGACQRQISGPAVSSRLSLPPLESGCIAVILLPHPTQKFSEGPINFCINTFFCMFKEMAVFHKFSVTVRKEGGRCLTWSSWYVQVVFLGKRHTFHLSYMRLKVDRFCFSFVVLDFDFIFKPLCLGVPVRNRWLIHME